MKQNQNILENWCRERKYRIKNIDFNALTRENYAAYRIGN